MATIVRENIDPQTRYIDKVRAIYDYVYDNMDYSKDLPGYGRGDVSRACKVGSGNCIDFHSWCGRCNWETKGLNRASAEFDDFIFIRINLMEPLDKVERFVQRYRIPYTVLPDQKGRLARLYGVKYVPTNIIID